MATTKPTVDYSTLTNGVEICMVMAIAENGIIGVNNSLPWNHPEDLARFKEITSGPGKALLMGYKTWQSLPIGKKTGEKLAGRMKYVLTTKAAELEPIKDTIFLSRWVKDHKRDMYLMGIKQLLVIGGAQVYLNMLPELDRAYITKVKAKPDGDTSFDLGFIDIHMKLIHSEEINKDLVFDTYIKHEYEKHPVY